MALLSFYCGLVLGGFLALGAISIFFLVKNDDEPHETTDRYWPMQPEGIEMESKPYHHPF